MASVLPREHKKMRLNRSLLRVDFFFIWLWLHIYVLGNAVTWLTQINVPIKYYITRFVSQWFTIHDSSLTEHIQQWFPYANVDGGGDTERVVNNTCGCWFQPIGPWLGLLLNNTHVQPTHLTVKEKKCSYKQRSQLQLIPECTSAILEVLCHQLLLSVPKSFPVWAQK